MGIAVYETDDVLGTCITNSATRNKDIHMYLVQRLFGFVGGFAVDEVPLYFA